MSDTQEEKISKLEQAHLDFISTVSHELRTPLTSIRGFADTLLTSYDRLSQEQREHFLLTIKEQSNRLIKLVENLLTASKMQSQKELLIYKVVNILPYIDSCIQVIKNQYPHHRFIVDYVKNPADIYVDTDKFQQIMINILDNAAKYSDNNTDIKVSVRQDFSANILSINVADNGIGISQEDISHIFEKFSRVDSPLTRKIQGNGLGLYITKTLTEMMGGKIEVKSSSKGSEFTLLFKIATPEDACIRKIKE